MQRKSVFNLFCCLILFFSLTFFAAVFSSCSLKSGSHKNGQSLTYPETMVLRMAEPAGDTHPSARASEFFANLVKVRSNGKINIKVYFDGDLGNSSEVIKQLQFGGIALGRVGFAELSEAVPSIAEFSQSVITKPLICRQSIEEKMDFLVEKFQSEKLYPLSVLYPDKRCFYTDSPRYFQRNLKLLKDLKIGTVSCRPIQKILKEYGAVPVDIISADTYESMQKGYMNVREAELSDFILSADYRFASYVMISEYVSNPGMIILSNEVCNQLTLEQKNMIIQCAKDAAEYQKTMMDRFYTANLAEVQKNKATLYLKQY